MEYYKKYMDQARKTAIATPLWTFLIDVIRHTLSNVYLKNNKS